MKKKFWISFWDYADIEAINEALDSKMKSGVATDIDYKIIKSEENGNLQLEATFTKEEY
jgi:hypothetical protein